MSVSVLESEHGAVMYCNTTMWAFGPVFDSVKDALQFKSWLSDDPRGYSDGELENQYGVWLQTRGLGFDSENEQEAFKDWLSKPFTDYERDVLKSIHNEWKATVWSG